jgi:hypothetical protein
MSMFHVVDEHDHVTPRMTMFRTLGAEPDGVHGVGYDHGVVPVPGRGHDHGVEHVDEAGDGHVLARGSSPDMAGPR